MHTVILADNQAITATGLHFLLTQEGDNSVVSANNKKELIRQLTMYPTALVILDYTLFDFSKVEELHIISQRFPDAHWLLFSEELSRALMVQLIVNEGNFGALLKDAPLEEINKALLSTLQNKPYISSHIKQFINETQLQTPVDKLTPLTQTEEEILRLLAMGRSTKEIAGQRFSSTHTIITHRKNIFRKLGVNTVHEATRYAIRAGLIDLAEYYI